MKKNILISGLVAGAIVTSWMIAAMTGLLKNPYAYSSMLLGYTTMLVAFSLIFVNVKNYRDKQNGGVVTFGKAFKIGLYITLIASTIYVVVWMIDYYYFATDFLEKMAAHAVNELKAKGASALEIKAKVDEMKKFGEMYKNPIINALMTYMEILPVGLIVSAICALILKRKQSTEDLVMAN